MLADCTTSPCFPGAGPSQAPTSCQCRPREGQWWQLRYLGSCHPYLRPGFSSWLQPRPCSGCCGHIKNRPVQGNKAAFTFCFSNFVTKKIKVSEQHLNLYKPAKPYVQRNFLKWNSDKNVIKNLAYLKKKCIYIYIHICTYIHYIYITIPSSVHISVHLNFTILPTEKLQLWRLTPWWSKLGLHLWC